MGKGVKSGVRISVVVIVLSVKMKLVSLVGIFGCVCNLVVVMD